jgi:predicted metal-dependent hydrolase
VKSKQTDNGLSLICVQSSTGPQIVPYKLERSRRIRRLSLQFDSTQFVTLKMPQRQAERHGIRFLEEHADWICQILASRPGVPQLRQYLMKHPRLAIAGRWYRLEIRFQQGSSGYRVDDLKRTVEISLNPRMAAEAHLLSVLKGIARDCLTARVVDLSGKVGEKAHGVTVRDQKSRWGSCSETGGISLNWRLILISPRLQDHVILHELAHLRHFDHSTDFHQFLHSLDPRTAEHAGKLDREALRVMGLGRQAS